MKSRTFKLSSALAGAIAISCALTAPLPAFAQANNPEPSSQNRQMRRPDFLNLSEAQKAQMEEIRQEEFAQINAVLTAEQKAQLESERANRRPPQRGTNARQSQAGGNRRRPPSPFASLNLSEEQRAQIETIRKATKEKLDALLTSEQRQRLEAHRAQRGQRRQQR